MSTRVFLPIIFILILLFSLGCGGSGTVAPPVDSANPAKVDLTGSPGLPPLSDLGLPNHDVSMVGPGWLELNVRETFSRSYATFPPNKLGLDGSAGLSYAMYGVHGFDGDCFPSSVKVIAEDVVGEFYIAFSYYRDDRWVHTGPYTNSVTAQIPNVNEFADPELYVSDTGRHYFTIICPEGSSMTISRVQLGLHGGADAPRPPMNLTGSGGEDGLRLSWVHSSDYRDPDFAGYLLERAPQFYGDFQPLNAEPVTDSVFLDTTVAMDITHRYRAASVDLNGNTSTWITANATRQSGTDTQPVAIFDLPHGPLYGPVDVTFDFSGSYDPMGGVIDQYSISYWGLEPTGITSPDPQITLTLQPGCYVFNGTVEVTADARMSTTSHRLVVYPRWKSAPVLVSGATPPAGSQYRMYYMQSYRDPATGLLTIVGDDETIPGLGIWEETPDGTFDFRYAPFYTEPTSHVQGTHFIGEMIKLQETLVVPYVSDENYYMLFIRDGLTEVRSFSPSNGVNLIDCVTDGSMITAIYAKPDGGHLDIIARDYNLGTTDVVLDNLGTGLFDIDAEYNPGSNMIDIVYCGSDGGTQFLRWIRWDPVNKTIVDSEELDTNILINIDLEWDPQTGRPALCYWSTIDNFIHYEYLDETGTWQTDGPIDNSVANSMQYDLAFGSTGPYVALGLFTGPTQQAKLYERDNGTGTWPARNTVSYSDYSALRVNLHPDPVGQDVTIADISSDGRVWLATLHDDGTETINPWHLDGSIGQGFEMHGASGTDGIHVVWQDRFGMYSNHHTISDDGGNTWQDQLSIGESHSIDLTSNVIGEVYMSYNRGGLSNLVFWDAGVWSVLEQVPVTNDFYRPFLSFGPYSSEILWTAFEDATNTMHYFAGQQPGPLAENSTVITTVPVWTGISNGFAGKHHFVAAGGTDPGNGRIGFFDESEAVLNPEIDPMYGEPINTIGTVATWGRSLESSFCFSDTGLGVFLFSRVYWSTAGSILDSIRYDQSPFGEMKPTNIPMVSNPYLQDFRKTVTAGLAYGGTAVGLLANMDCTVTHFEWSNFGEWEELPIPEQDYMSMPELIIGRDGRWHIVYKNYRTDEIWCISTRE